MEEPGFGRRHLWTPAHACETDHSSLVGWDDTEKTTNDERKDYVADWRWHREDQKRKHRLRCGLGMTRTRPDQVAADGFLVRTWWGMIGEWGGKDLKINNICHVHFCWWDPISCIDQMPLVDRNQSKTAWGKNPHLLQDIQECEETSKRPFKGQLKIEIKARQRGREKPYVHQSPSSLQDWDRVHPVLTGQHFSSVSLIIRFSWQISAVASRPCNKMTALCCSNAGDIML